MTRTFSLEFDPASALHGWMDCWLVVDGERHHIDTTSVFPPFKDLLQFARALATNQLPHEFFWEEEGHGAKFQALPSAADSACFRLQINHDGNVVVDAEFDRQKIAAGLLEALRKVSLDCPGAESEWEFPYFLVEDFEESLKNGQLAQPIEAPDRRVRFVFYHFGGYGGMDHPAFNIWVGSNYLMFMDMEDNAQHWQAWFTLLEKLRHGELPVEQVITHYQDSEEDEDLIWLPGYRTSTTYRLEATADENLFRLIITGTFPQTLPMEQSFLVDLVLDRHQFVESFVQSFEEFLRTNYLAFLNSGECNFDLRTLPLDKLYS
jgi:hypothetical protein